MKNIYKILLIVFIGVSSCFYPFNNVYAEGEDGIQETTSQTEESEDVSESVSNEITEEINKTEEESTGNNNQNSVQEESDSVEGEGYYEILGVNETGPVFGDYVNPQGGGFPYEDLKMQGVSYLYESPAESDGIEPVSDDTIAEVGRLIKAALATKPFTSSEVVGLLGNSKNTLLRESNNTDLVKAELLSNNGDRSEYIYVVDENAVVFVVKDVNGNGIPNACVSISYLDDNGTRINRTVTTTDGEVKGIAAFDDLKGTRYGFVDIEAYGYHSVTFLDEEMTGGVVKNVVLEKNKEFEIYLRTVDLDGRDLINNDTTLTLVKDYDETLPFSIIVSSTGYRQLPKTLKLISTTDNRTICTFAAPSYYKGDKDSYIFQANKKWVTQDALLKENDKLALEIDGETFPLKNVIVENAQVDPGYIDDKDMPIKGDTLIDDKEDAGSLMNVFNIGLSELSLNVSVGIMPSGKFWIMCTRKIESWSKDMPELFGKSPSPKAAEKTGTIMERITKSVEASFDKAVWTDEKIQAKTTTFLIDPTYGI